MYPALVLAQTGNTETTTPKDVDGKMDVDFGTVWEKIDNLIDGAIERIPYVVLAIVVFVLMYFVAKVVRSLIRKATDNRESANLGRVVGRLAQWVILFVALLICIGIVAPSVGAGKLLSTLGIGGVAIGFAFKDILQNFLAGILLLVREPFKVGDQIVSGDHEGTVESIETRATNIRTYDGKLIVVPNSQIFTNPVTVNTAFGSSRNQYDVGIGYGDDMREATSVMQSALEQTEGVLSDPAPDVLAVELAGSSVVLRARWWTDPNRANVMQVQHEVITNLKEALDDAMIDMPYPTNVVLLHDQTEETDGDRTQQREGWPAGQSPPEPRPIGSGNDDSVNAQA